MMWRRKKPVPTQSADPLPLPLLRGVPPPLVYVGQRWQVTVVEIATDVMGLSHVDETYHDDVANTWTMPNGSLHLEWRTDGYKLTKTVTYAAGTWRSYTTQEAPKHGS